MTIITSTGNELMVDFNKASELSTEQINNGMNQLKKAGLLEIEETDEGIVSSLKTDISIVQPRRVIPVTFIHTDGRKERKPGRVEYTTGNDSYHIIRTGEQVDYSNGDQGTFFDMSNLPTKPKARRVSKPKPKTIVKDAYQSSLFGLVIKNESTDNETDSEQSDK